MATQHVGKKRRKEVREAVSMRREIRRTNITLVIGVALVLAVMVGCTAVAALGLASGHLIIVQSIVLLVVFFAVAVLGFRLNGYWSLRGRFKEHCRRFNISKEDMKALEQGKL